MAEFEKSIDIPDQNDDFNAIREEYRTMLKNQLSKGNNGLVKTCLLYTSRKAPLRNSA